MGLRAMRHVRTDVLIALVGVLVALDVKEIVPEGAVLDAAAVQVIVKVAVILAVLLVQLGVRPALGVLLVPGVKAAVVLVVPVALRPVPVAVLAIVKQLATRCVQQLAKDNVRVNVTALPRALLVLQFNYLKKLF